MKKVINILLMAAMAAGTLAGCGGKSSESGNTANADWDCIHFKGWNGNPLDH